MLIILLVWIYLYIIIYYKMHSRKIINHYFERLWKDTFIYYLLTMPTIFSGLFVSIEVIKSWVYSYCYTCITLLLFFYLVNWAEISHFHYLHACVWVCVSVTNLSRLYSVCEFLTKVSTPNSWAILVIAPSLSFP